VHRYYASSSFDEKSSKPKTIAILPPQLVVTGMMPKNLTSYDVAQLERKRKQILPGTQRIK
jgi:hypothetical protein